MLINSIISLLGYCLEYGLIILLALIFYIVYFDAKIASVTKIRKICLYSLLLIWFAWMIIGDMFLEDKTILDVLKFGFVLFLFIFFATFIKNEKTKYVLKNKLPVFASIVFLSVIVLYIVDATLNDYPPLPGIFSITECITVDPLSGPYLAGPEQIDVVDYINKSSNPPFRKILLKLKWQNSSDRFPCVYSY